MQHKWEGCVHFVSRLRKVRYHYSLRLRTLLGYREKYVLNDGVWCRRRRASLCVRLRLCVYALTRVRALAFACDGVFACSLSLKLHLPPPTEDRFRRGV